MSAGTGYNIPISVSAASTTSLPQNANTPTYFIFDSPGNNIGATSQQADPVQPATATSSAAEGNASSKSSGSGVGMPSGGGLSDVLTGQMINGVPNWVLIGAAAALLYLISRR